MKRYLAQALFLTIFFSGVSFGQEKAKTDQANYIHRAVKAVTDVMVYDIYSPPVTSRTYAYISVAGYEVMRKGNPNYLTFAGQLNGLNDIPAPEKGKEYNSTLAAVEAIITTGKTMVISEKKLTDFEKGILDEFKNAGIPHDVMDNSIKYGKIVAQHIITWAATDRYKQIRSLPDYSVKQGAAYWKPTPPAYIKAVEPNWNKLRTFVIDSAQQFKPEAPPEFSVDTTSTFYADVAAVYQKVNKNSPEEQEIANFWDCNPFKMNVRGHVMYATKKVSPNGHWMNITRLACKGEGADGIKSAEAYARVAVTLADCFISCWDEKYRSSVIRPETYINKYIDPNWRPVLQTPPFPEYTSGHSMVSSSAAIVLTELFGPDFSFLDTTELEFGLQPRKYKSFLDAAKEAAISRFYGGIHYMPAIINGQKEGFALGRYVDERLTTENSENPSQR